MKYKEIMAKDRAGVIPFYRRDDGEIMMMFRTPSDPKFGGKKPQVAKGGIDPGESVLAAAIREGEEELGLLQANIINTFTIPAQQINGDDAPYKLHMFALEIDDPTHFGQHDHETAEVMWMTIADFARVGRKNQQPIVKLALNIIN
jgi:8-oxo-dGTP pyrophosphatase MutT (NUDIX family)